MMKPWCISFPLELLSPLEFAEVAFGKVTAPDPVGVLVVVT